METPGSRPGMLDAAMFRLLEVTGQLEAVDGRFKSKLRFATLGELIFAHTAFPTRERDAVFFGPNTYRFVAALRHAIPAGDAARPPTLFDIGCGCGAGGIYAARHLLPRGVRIVLSDINARALMFAAANAQLNDVPDLDVATSDLLDGLEGTPDIVIANPPYLVDEDARLYRDGGGDHGTGSRSALSNRVCGGLRRKAASSSTWERRLSPAWTCFRQA